MALIDLQTNFRSLKFGLGQASDKPGGGYSNQPYIVKPIPDYDDDPSNIFNTGGPDFLLRGGLTAPIKSVNDVSRLAQMFFDLKSPNGLLFTAKQNVLSRTSVKTEASVGPGTAGGTINQGVYLPTSTLAQAAVGFTGTHLNLLGLNPASPGLDNNSLLSQIANAGLVKYETAAKAANSPDNNIFSITAKTLRERNPDFDLFQSTNPLILGSEQPNPFSEFIETLIPAVNGKFENRLLKIWYDKQDSKNNDTNVLEYGGGPGSILGIGKTQIKFADQRTGVNNPNYLGNSIPNQDLQDLRDTTRQVFYRASNLAISASVLNVADMEYQVNRNGEKSNVLTRTQDELSTPPKVPIFDNTAGINPSLYNNGASNKYNVLISSSVNSYNSKLVTTDFPIGRDFFSVYEPAIEGNTWPTTTPLQSANNSSTWTQEQIIQVPEEDTNAGTVSDFRRPLIEDQSQSTIMSLSPDYRTQNIEQRVSLGNPGRKGRNVINYTIGNGALDKITAGGFYSGSSPNHSRAEDRNDLVKFSIGLLQNNGSGVSNYMHFRAFINEFSDGYSAEWGETRYIGRGDKFYNYKGFDRKISMGWTVYAQSREELIPMYKKLNYLASSLAPDYSSGGYMRGNLARLTVGGYLYNQLGIIKSITYTIPNESTWEIGISSEPRPDGNLFDSSVKELAHMINVTGFEFIPIEKSIPEKGKTRFIHLSTGEGSANTNWGDGNVDMPVDPSPSVPPQPKTTPAPPPKEKDPTPAIDTSIGTVTNEGFTRNDQLRNTTQPDATVNNFLYVPPSER